MNFAMRPIQGKAKDTDPLWPEFQADLQAHPGGTLVTSGRTCGQYLITPEAIRALAGHGLFAVSDEARAKITTWIQEQGRNPPQPVTPDVINAEATRPRRGIRERARMLLGALKEWEDKRNSNTTFSTYEGVWIDDGGKIELMNPDILTCETAGSNLCAMARSESTGWREVETLLAYLAREGWIEEIPDRDAEFRTEPLDQITCRVSAYGHDTLERRTRRESGKAFVAMWFDPEMNDAYDNGIEPALMYLGYEPIRVDRVLSTDDIVAEIFDQIAECDLMVADFTHGKDGSRGGVYYEAGYAEGLGKPVIMACRADQLPDIHFDTSHRFHIVWKTPKDLRDALKERIPARVAAKSALAM